MASKAPTDVNHKLSDVKASLKENIPHLKRIAEDRKELNDEKREILDTLEESHGLNRKAVQDAMKYHTLPDGQKDGYDLSYQITREVMGAPFQPDLFKQPKDEDDDAKGSDPAAADAGEEADNVVAMA